MTLQAKLHSLAGNSLLVLAALILVCCGIASAARAQSTFATVQGTVLDASGASIPNATVVVTNEQTGAIETVHAGAKGEYRVFDLDAGTYSFVFSGAGFGTNSIEHQVLLARAVLRLDAHLATGSVATSVDVTAGGTGFSDVATVSQSLSSADIDTLALNFRASDTTSPLYVAALTPGVQTDPSGNISVAGGFSYTTSYSIDGVSTVNARNNGPSANLFPSVEAIGEFKVNTANNDAEFGQPSDITVTTKSGTNKYHGGLYDFYASSSFNAANPITHLKGHLTANDFGAYVGGPLTIPHLYQAQDKTFFFVDYEGTRKPEAGSIDISVPSDAFRGGDLSALLGPACVSGGYTVLPTGYAICNSGTYAGMIDPAQLFNLKAGGTAYVNNQVPVNPSSQALENALYPHANLPGLVNNYQTSFPGNYTQDGIDVRLDHQITQKHKVWARFGGKDVKLTGLDSSANTGYDPANGVFSSTQKLRNVVGDYSWTISPSLVNEARGGYSLANFDSGYPLAAQGSAIIAAAGITGLPTAPASGGVPDVIFADNSFVTANQDGRPHVTKNLTYNLNDQVTYVRGSHALKFGIDYQHYHFQDYLAFTAGDQYGDYDFNGALTTNPTPGAVTAPSAFADFLVGLPYYTDYSVDGPDVQPYAHSYGFYAQDSWKPLTNLTIDYGLRYEIHAPFNDSTKQLANFDPTYPGGRVVVQGQTGLNQVLPIFKTSIGSTPIVTNQMAGLPDTLRDTYYGDVDPRFGFTFTPMPNVKYRTVIHAGVGAYTVPVLGSVLYSLAGVATSNYLLFPQTSTLSLQFPNVFPTGAGGQSGKPDFRRANQINLKDPREIQWSGQIEQGIGFATVLRIGYTGSHATQLIHSPDLNQIPSNTLGYAAYVAKNGLPFPNFNAVLTRANGPSDKYDAMTVEVERRYVKGLTLDANYTLADSTSNALGSVPTALSAENGPTTLDRFNLSADYGNVIYVRRNRFVGTFQYELPYGRGQKFGSNSNYLVNLVAGGWSVAGIQLWQSGPFLTPTFTGTDPSGTGVLLRGVTTAQRPDCVSTNYYAANKTRNGWFNPAAFAVPANNIGRYGNCSVGSLIGPGTVTFAGTAGKNFALTPRLNLRYEAQFANLFNHTNLAVPATNISSPSTFGTISNVQDANTSYGPSAGPRNVQMSLRLTF
jgi:hypothetical protein